MNRRPGQNVGEDDFILERYPTRYTTRDPTTQYVKPPFDKQPRPEPRQTAEIDPKPDHGEATYRGSGRPTDRKAIVTGADSGIGRAVGIAFTREGANVVLSYVYAVFWTCKAAVPPMAPRSTIINTSSVQEYQPPLSLLDYASTKSVNNTFSKALA